LAPVARNLTLLLAGWVALAISNPVASTGAEYGLRGQASGWVDTEKADNKWNTGLGTHYLPQLTISQDIRDDTFLDLEVALEAFARTRQGDQDDTAGVDLYRMKLRFATPRTETRLGLQQINFGPAYLLRSLRWFDRLDPRDPLGLTDGVYALSFKYVAQSNTSLWLWGLYGNEEPKGNEVLASLREEPEAGGRLEVPVLLGEVAFTFHYRWVDGPEPMIEDFAERRFALDGRWDIVIGGWVETVLIHQRSKDLPYEWRKMITLGADYTFPIGNGLHTLLEHMAVVPSDEALGWVEDSHISGLSLSYPVGYADRLAVMPFYYWDSREYSFYTAWEHYWDRLSLNLSFYRYPDVEAETGQLGPAVPGGGRGARLLLVYNH
jgi:hypothetical protein